VKLEGEQVLLRLHLSNFARWHTAPVYEAVLNKARKLHLAGATVLSGMYGYVERGHILGERSRLFQIERPVVVEIVDREEALRELLAAIEPMLAGHAARITMERAHVVHYRGGEGAPS